MALMLLFSWWLVPAFRDMFSDFGIECPEVTQLVIGMSFRRKRGAGLGC